MSHRVTGRVRLLTVLVAGSLASGVLAASATAAAASPAVPTTAAPTTAAAAQSGTFVPVAPARLLDTRSGAGAPRARVATGYGVVLQVSGRGGLPTTGVGAVALNVTVVGASASGYVTVHPGGSPTPTASNLNYVAGVTVANAVTVGVATDGTVALDNGPVAGTGSVDLVADVVGYFIGGTTTVAGGFTPVTPARLLDTRAGIGAPRAQVRAGRTVPLKVTGVGGVPDSGVAAVVLNLTATGASAAGYLTAYPAGTIPPTVSNVNFVRGRAVPNLATVRVGSLGLVDLIPGPAAGVLSVDLVADVFGYYLAGTATVAGAFVPVDPARVLDTRSGIGAPRGQVVSGTAVTLQVTGRGGVRDSGVGAVVANVTATGARGGGYVTAFPAGTTVPPTSNLNYAAGQTVANLVSVQTDDSGRIALRNGNPGGAAVDLIADVAGYYLAATSFRWGAPTRIDNDGDGLADVSCPTATFCAAADSHNVAFWDGVRWGTPLVADQEVLQSLACSSSSFCVAGDLQGDVVAWDGTSWSAARHVSNHNPIGGYIDALQCPTATTCIALDNAGYAFTSHDGFLTTGAGVSTGMRGGKLSCPTASFCAIADYDGRFATFDGTTPTAPVQSPDTYIASVSCTSATFCTAVSETRSYLWDGTRWTPGSLTDGKALLAVACASTTACIASDVAGRVLQWNGATWDAPTAVSTAALGGLACASSTMCWAAGDDGTAARFDGTSWSAPQPVSPLGGSLTAVSCATDTSCAAVDAGYSFSDASGRATAFDGTGWAATTLASKSAGFVDVSCASATFCVALDSQADTARFTGTRWSNAASTTLGSFPAAVSCATSRFCAAVDDIAGVSFLTGTGWTEGARIDGFNAANDISCPVAGFCVAVADNGDAATYRNGAWEPSIEVEQDDALAFVSCSSMTACAGADRGGRVFDYDGTTWSRVADSGVTSPTGLSCASVELCAIVDATGHAAVRQGGAWSAPVVVDSGSGGQTPYLTGVSCPIGGTTCTAISNAGNAIRGG